MELGAPSVEDSVTLLRKAAGHKEDGVSDRASVEELVKRIGCLPLAVEQAGAYMKQKRMPANELRTLYESSTLEDVINWENSFVKYEHKSVQASFAISLQELRRVSPDAWHLLNVLAFFDPETIPLDLVAHGAERTRDRLAESLASTACATPAPEQQSSIFIRTMTKLMCKRTKPSLTNGGTNNNNGGAFDSAPVLTSKLVDLVCSKEALRDAVGNLEKLSLAQCPLGDNPPIHIHDLIQMVLLYQSAKVEQAEEYHDVAVTLLISAFKKITDIRLPQSWAECERFVPHLMSLEKHRPAKIPPSKEFMDMSQDIAEYFHERGRYNEAEALLIRVLAQREKAAGIGEDHLDTLGTVHALAEVYMDLGKYDKAEEFFGRALAGREKQIGADHRDTLGTLNGLARLRHLQHRYNDAEELYTRLLEKQKVQLGAEHLDTLGAVNGLARVYDKQSKLDDAMPFYKRVLAGNENQRGSEHPDTLAVMANLGELYRVQGKYDEAEPLLARVLRSRETQLGEEHPDTLDVGHNLASLYDDQGKYDEAETLYARVLAGEEKQLGAEHPSTLATVHNFAGLCWSQGRWEEAEELYRRALAGFEKVCGREHGDTRQAVKNLAYVYQRQGRDEEAEKLRARFREVGQQA
ncbi:hypothetical protein HWV62_1290 [Athelia sp. TMB]|nr:hypothetical protein HWV62_1290 [Athelia sp. TMB]